MDNVNVPPLRKAFDLLPFTVSPINSSSQLCPDDALTPECNILHADAKQMAWFAFQVVQIRCYSLLCSVRKVLLQNCCKRIFRRFSKLCCFYLYCMFCFVVVFFF